MEIAVLGAGHVGLVCASCLASIGHRVRVQDVDRTRIARLVDGQLPFVEPGLDALLADGLDAGSLSFHVDPEEALASAELIFICVPTSMDGATSDLSRIVEATVSAAHHGHEDAVLVNRTTAPVGTLAYVRTLLEQEGAGSIGVASNPEFLSEGTAVADFLAPYRIVVGGWENGAVARVVDAYQPILDGRLPSNVEAIAADRQADPGVRLLITTPETAEFSKYAADAFLAVKISFINEIVTVADELGADADDVASTLRLDPRIGPRFLNPGIGWAGSCFPKEITVLKGMSQTSGVATRLLTAANDVNDEQRRWVVRKLRAHLKTLEGRRVALLGLSFKPATDDLRNAPALEIAAELFGSNVDVRAFDPIVTELPPQFADAIELVSDPLSAASDADAVVITTAWEGLADLPLDELRRVMRVPLLLDGRNCLDPVAARAAGFNYVGVGREGRTVLPMVPPPVPASRGSSGRGGRQNPHPTLDTHARAGVPASSRKDRSG
ncbi:MAG: UDP-glucose/GDP-mannose dehydrogenase family protein [Actinomycetota bacterium]|nr:UDP-glucose/GDP-mannose dehydrogenase family protein [Actinomycetota bacterium]